MKNLKLILLTAALFFCAAKVNAQIAQGGTYTLNQSLIASGGGASAGGTYQNVGTTGEAVAGTTSTGGTFLVKGGFFAPQFLSPTAASVTVSGRVTNSAGKGIRNVIVTMTDASGAIRTTVSGVFGRFSFMDVAAGETYIFSASAKHFTFSQPAQIFSIVQDTDDIIFVGEPTGLQAP